MVDGDTSGYYFCIIACSVHDSCFDTIVCLFLDIRMTGKAHLQNIETREKYNFTWYFCDADKAQVQLKVHHPKYHGSPTQTGIA